ncbi:MAG: two-component system response regulator OmpR [Candidatus Parabeggiatoa sp. nov. 1]|nr:MAG: two-component system response regulator OmpR [Gammaproteobacteria bacterium]
MDKREQLLIVDDDIAFCQLVQDYLTVHGFDIAGVHDGRAMTQFLSQHVVDLIILDVMLPGDSGLLLARQLRAENYHNPIIMLSSLGDEADRIIGLENGANTYLPKPVSLRELLAYVRAMLRRHTSQPKIYTFGPFALNTRTHRLTKANVEMTITNADYNLLLAFVTHPNQVLSRNKLTKLAKHTNWAPDENRNIDVGVTRLRKKIEIEPSTPSYLRTIHGRGYIFSPSPESEFDLKA